MSFDFKKDPIDNFLELLKEAQAKGIPDAHAMALATVDQEKRPSVRIVYYKGLFERGLCFYTNYFGHKGHDLADNPNIAANFFWPHLDQQIRFQGLVKKLPREQSEKYFHSRPRLSQVGAWASNQSEEIPSYQFLEDKITKLAKQYDGQNVPCPPHWGGYQIIPTEIEFWFGRQGRLHERYVYARNKAQDDWRRFLRSP